MKKTKLFNLILSSIICLITAGSIIGSFLLAKEADDTIYVRNKNDLNNIRNNLAGHYVFNVDGYIDIDESWVPIGSKEHPFTGYIEGNGHGINMKNGFFIGNESSDIGLFAYNEGIIKHLKVMVYGQTLNFESNDCKYETLNLGMVCGVNAGYVTGCKIYFSKLSIAEKIASLNCGGVAGVNSGQIQGCSINSGTNLDITSNTNFGFFVGKSCGNSIIKYCWRSNYFLINCNGENNCIGYCCGYCESGHFENIGISLQNGNFDLPVELIINSKNNSNIIVGGLIGKINAKGDISVNNIALNLSFMSNILFGNYSFVVPIINTNNHPLKLNNIWCSGKVSLSSNSEITGNVVYAKCDNENLLSTNHIFRSDIVCSGDFISTQGTYKPFSDLKLSDLSFDEAVWKKGAYCFYLDYEKSV